MNELLLNAKIFQLAPNLSRADVAILLAALVDGDEARNAYEYWREQLRWEAVPVQWQRLLPLLHQNLTRMGVKDGFLERIKGVRRFMWARNLRLIALAKTVHGELSQGGVSALSLKGTSLVASRYVDRSIRPMDDIDILIPADQMTDAIDVLSRLGISPRFVRPASFLDRVLPERNLSGWPFANSSGDEVDIHWNAMHLDRRIDSDRDAWSNSRIVQFEGTDIRVLSPTDQLIHICAHGARDPDAGSIRWISDAVLVIRQARNIDWNAVVERARVHRLSAVMARALDLLSTLFDIPVGSQIIVQLYGQSTWCERLEVQFWNRRPVLWTKGLSGIFLAMQEFRRGRADLFNASALRTLRDYTIKKAGTRGILSALSCQLYFWLGKPLFLRPILAPDGYLLLAPIHRIPFVADMDFTTSNVSEAMFPHGWSVGEISGRWTDGHRATIALRLERPSRKLPTLRFDIVPATNPDQPQLTISVFVNDKRVIERRFNWGLPEPEPLICATPIMAKPATIILVTFEIRNPRQSLGSDESADPRYLGIFLSRLTVASLLQPTDAAAEAINVQTDAVATTERARETVGGPAIPATSGIFPNRGTMEEINQDILDRLKAIEDKIASLEAGQERLQNAYSMSRAHLRRFWMRPPMWTFEQHTPRSLNLLALPTAPALPSDVPTIAIVTPSHNHARFLGATIESVLSQNYPKLVYHVQDGNSDDGSVSVLESYGDRISWRSVPDKGQSDAVNLGFAGIDCDIMAYLNSDDVLLPGTLAYIADFFHRRPDVDIVYGHRIFIDSDGSEIGRAILPAHRDKTLLFADYVPQETMFWRRRVWDANGAMDVNLHYALDWDFLLRAQTAGFKLERARRFLACFRVHDNQKTTRNYDVGHKEMQALRLRYLGHKPSQREIYRALMPYLTRQLIFHWSYKLGLLKS